MKRVFIVVAFILAVLVSGFQGAQGQELTTDALKKTLGLELYLQGGYTYNIETPDSQTNDHRAFDWKADSFMLDLAQIRMGKEPETRGVGYRLKLSAGSTAKLIHAEGLGQADDAFDLTEAYLSYVAPVGYGLRFDFGKMGTFIGAEAIEANENPNYSRSLLFLYAQPLTHTGLKVSYPFGDMLGAAVYLVNGWDNAEDNNKAKSVGASVAYRPTDTMTMKFNVLYGPEQDNNVSNNRFLFDWVGTFDLAKQLALGVNFDYGTEKGASLTGGSATWYGVSATVRYAFTDMYAIAGRVEYFDDKDGARTGVEQKLQEVTITGEIVLAKNLMVRPEVRHDWSNENTFDSLQDDTQDTIAVGVMYLW